MATDRVGLRVGAMGRPQSVEQRSDMTSFIFQNEFSAYWVEK